MITILTRHPSIFYKESIKECIKKILKIQRGPSGVIKSLESGLKEIDCNYQINPPIKKISEVVNVISGIEALKLAIRLKKEGKIKTLIAGPNLVVTPHDHNHILCHLSIDAVLVPSEWIKKFYIEMSPEIQNKTYVWAAGTKVDDVIKRTEKDTCIVYKKDVPVDLYTSVIKELESRDIKYTLIEYGKYRSDDYFNTLNHSKYMIYLQKVESQGLSLQESWARNVPTLVWNPGFFSYPNGYTAYGNISAPYLSSESGLFFENKNEFSEKLNTFLEQLDNFKPREYCINNLSNKVSAEKYINLINSINNKHEQRTA